MKLKVTVNGQEYVIDVEVEEDEQQNAALAPIVIGGGGPLAAPTKGTASMPAASSNAVVAPLAGSVARILVSEGDEISTGQVLVVLEAMKMETEITAPGDGKVGSIVVEAGQAVQGGQPLIELV
ncbi:biotin/lipoyl-containing protein [Luteococcus sp. OSA5]|uniref:biotin/lipoyl-containing protein n=1 Tax=Luteococcus sp. OSA5 TaxID=3401630 RepID=UPI003B4328AF